MSVRFDHSPAALAAGLLMAGLALSPTAALGGQHTLKSHSLEAPGKATATAISGGAKISNQVKPTAKVRLICAHGFRVVRMGSKTFPANKRYRTEVVPLEPLTDAASLARACKGGHGAVLAKNTIKHKCKKVKVVVGPTAAAYRPQVFPQYELKCENLPVAGAAKTPLKLYWSSARQENFVAGTAAGAGAATKASYKLVRFEGQLLKKAGTNTVPLKLYWNSARKDNFSATTAAGQAAAKKAGYKYSRVQGHVFRPDKPPPKGTVPLELYWSASRKDNLSLASDATRKAAKAAGYTRVRLQGYIYKLPNVHFDLNASGSFK